MLRKILLLFALSCAAHGKKLSLWTTWDSTPDVSTFDTTVDTTEAPWSSTPYCGGLEECICPEDEAVPWLFEEEECCPCVCKVEGWCRKCVCPKTTHCQCICGNPNVTMADPETLMPPAISVIEVALGLVDLGANLTECLEDVDDQREIVELCFGEDFVKPILNPVVRKIERALEAAENASIYLSDFENLYDLDNPDLIRSLEELASEILKAKDKLHDFMVAIAIEIADRTGTDLDDIDLDNPDETGTLLDDWNTDEEPACTGAKVILRQWHPTFWEWSTWGGEFTWSLWSKLCFYWLCVLYIRITIIVKIWWYWFWQPWEYLYPWFWCFWWPPIPDVGFF